MGFNIVKLTDPIQFTNVAGGLVPKGAYAAGTDYAVGDSVDYNGSSYVMHTDAAAGTVPTNTTYWQVLANKGDTGETATNHALLNNLAYADSGHTGFEPAKGADDNYVTDAEKVVIGNTSGTNTGDQDLSAYQLEPSEGAFVDGDKTKLDGIEALADVTDATNVAAAGAIMDGDITGNGLVTRTGAGAYTNRTITGTSNQVTVSNGNGVSGNPTLSLPQNIDTSATPTFSSLTAGTATDVLGTALSVIRNNVAVGRIDNNASGLRVQAQNGSLQLRGTGNTGIAIDASGNAVVAGTITGANLSGTNTGDNATNSQYSGLDAAKVNKAGDTMSGDLNMGTNELIGGTGITDILKLQGTTGNGTAASAAIQLLTGNNGATTALTVLNNGNVGIGTTSPANKLHVVGGSGLPATSGTSQTAGYRISGQTGTTTVLDMGIFNGTGSSWIQSTDSTNLATNWNLLLNPNGGNVGIGTTTPGYKLVVNGDHINTQFLMHSSGDGGAINTADLMLWASEPNATYSGVGIANNMYNTTAFPRINTNRGGSMMRLLDNSIAFTTVNSSGVQVNGMSLNGGNVGIGTTAPSEKLDVSGTVKATGYKSSDGSAGVSGSFTTTDGKTITIKDGLVVSIV